jgi:two-component system nitrogen regulation sensor histidine kinase GlnL
MTLTHIPSEWLESLPFPALLVGPDFTLLAANSLSPSLPKKLHDALPVGHPLALALMRLFKEERSTRLTGVQLMNLPACNGYVTAAPDGAALVVLEITQESQLGTTETYTELSAELAAMLAHEIRNPLLSIRGAAQLLSGNVGAEDVALTTLIINEVARIDQLIATMDPLSVTPPHAIGPINIHEALEHARMAAVAAFGPNIQYVQQYDPSLPPVAANHDALVQALTNLLKNAAEAVEQMPEPRITLTTRYTLGETRRNAHGLALPIAVSIADNGAGVPPRLEERLFAPFVTTKVNGKGLGLSIVARIVEEHGGLVAHDRPKEGGARFTLYLPMV